MKKILIIAIIVQLLFACTQEKQNIKEDKGTQLKELKEELITIQDKIFVLEKEIAPKEKDLLTSVKTQKLETSVFNHYIQVTGSVKADKNITISPETSGNIIYINVKEGQRVKKGDILAKLNTAQIQHSIEEININLDFAKTKFARQENLWKQNIGSEMQFLTAKSQKEALERKLQATTEQLNLAIIKAPFSGTIDEIFQKKGEIANPQKPFLQLVNIDNVYIEADVSENHLTKISKKDNVEINFPALDKNITGKINRISNIIDPANRSFKIKINIRNTSNIIKPNLTSTIKLRDYHIAQAIVIPSIIVKKDFEGEYVYIARNVDKKLTAVKQYITSSMSYNNQTLIKSGLSIGDLIITAGYAQIVNGTLISNKK